MRFKLMKPDDYDPNDEKWQFLPGSEVEGRIEKISGRDVLVAVVHADQA
jgi:hypothetical protein